MDGLVLLQEKLEEVILLIKSFRPEDLVKAGRVWNTFSLQFQSIINLDVDDTITNQSLNTRKYSSPIKPKLNISQQTTTKKQVIIATKSSAQNDEYQEETCISKTVPDNSASQLQSCKNDELFENSSANGQNSSNFDKESKSNTSPSFIQNEAQISSIHESEAQQHENASVRAQSSSEVVEKVASGRFKGKQFICDECGVAFSTRGNFNVHLRKHTSERPFPCTKCSKRFNTSSNLRRHLLSYHQGVKPYHCAIPNCDARFTERKSLVIHVRRHTGEKPFECNVCGKSYMKRWVLSQHLKTHQGDQGKSHLCHQCGKSFTQKSQLKLHEKRHSGVKNNICSYCESSFTTKSDLLRHEKTHSNKKAFVCLRDQCGKSFARSHRLKDHLLKHEQEQTAEIMQDSESIKI